MEQEQPRQRSERITTYPLVLTQLRRRRVIVVGGGRVAERKVGGLIEGGARPLVISPDLTPRLRAWLDEGAIEYNAGRYTAADLTGAFIVVAATNDRAVNAQIAADCADLPVLLNVADDPRASTMHTVASVRADDLLIAVSTGGTNPRRAAEVRRELAERYGNET